MGDKFAGDNGHVAVMNFGIATSFDLNPLKRIPAGLAGGFRNESLSEKNDGGGSSQAYCLSIFYSATRTPRGGNDMGLIKEFKTFAMRGNVLDLAVGVIIGGAFGKIVGSFVGDVMMPVLGLLMGGVDFTSKFVALKGGTYATLADAKAAHAATLNYGVFIQSIIDFVIVAFAIFLLIKGVNSMQKKEAEKPAPPPAPSNEEKLLTDIRDLLKAR